MFEFAKKYHITFTVIVIILLLTNVFTYLKYHGAVGIGPFTDDKELKKLAAEINSDKK